MSVSTDTNELVDPAALTNSQRGQLAELIFIRKAASLGFAVAKPWAEGERYDAIVRVQNRLWRVQVKSVLHKVTSRAYYRALTSGRKGSSGRRTAYSANEIDFLVVYIFAEDTWYVFPVDFIQGRQFVWVNPACKSSKFEPYREAWHLMKPVDRQNGAQRVLGHDGSNSVSEEAELQFST